MNLITDIVKLYDFIIKFENPLELDIEYNGDKLKYGILLFKKFILLYFT
jgi:hypothetical protein